MGDSLISVLMPAFNCRATLEEAAGCILGQTLGDFELIIIDDGSKDDSLSVIESLAQGTMRGCDFYRRKIVEWGRRLSNRGLEDGTGGS